MAAFELICPQLQSIPARFWGWPNPEFTHKIRRVKPRASFHVIPRPTMLTAPSPIGDHDTYAAPTRTRVSR